MNLIEGAFAKMDDTIRGLKELSYGLDLSEEDSKAVKENLEKAREYFRKAMDLYFSAKNKKVEGT